MSESTSRHAIRASLRLLAACAAAALGLSVADALAQGWGGWWPWSQPEPRRCRASRSTGRRRTRCRPGSSRRASRRRDRSLKARARASRRATAPAQQHLPAARAAAGGGDAGRQPGPRPAAQDRERHAPAGAQLPGGAAAAQPRRLLGPVPVLQDAAAHAALHPARRRGRGQPAAARRPRGPAPPDHGHARPLLPGRHHPRARPQRLRPAVRHRDAPARGPQPVLHAVGRGGATSPRGSPNQFGNLPFATYRTLCVRLCDGYYFPVSFSTLPNHFQRDADLCQSQCAAPAELYYHQNPGGAVEQMVSVGNQQPYTSLKIGVALSQGVRAGLLVQGGRVPAAGGRRQEGRGAGGTRRGDRAAQRPVVAGKPARGRASTSLAAPAGARAAVDVERRGRVSAYGARFQHPTHRLDERLTLRPIGIDDFSACATCTRRRCARRPSTCCRTRRWRPSSGSSTRRPIPTLLMKEEVYGAWLDGELVGTVELACQRGQRRSTARIGCIFVRHPRLGIGRRLLAEVEARAHQCGFEHARRRRHGQRRAVLRAARLYGRLARGQDACRRLLAPRHLPRKELTGPRSALH